MIGLRRLISGIFFILSLVTIIGMIILMNDLLSGVGMHINWDGFISLLENGEPKQILSAFTALMYGVFLLLGTPIIVLLVSMISLTMKDKD